MTLEKCQAKGCKRKVVVKKHGLCRTHAVRLYLTGVIGEGKIRKYKRYEPFKLSEEKNISK